jgi:hypothetical protein
MVWRAILAFLFLLALTTAVLYMAYTVIPEVRNVPTDYERNNVTYSATGVLVKAPSRVVDASGNVWRWLY